MRRTSEPFVRVIGSLAGPGHEIGHRSREAQLEGHHLTSQGYNLRLQLTTRCQLRCPYCRPSAVSAIERSAMNAETAAAFVRVLVRTGVRRVRITGGEPLVADAVGAVRALAAIPGLEEIALTTNGELLAPRAKELREAGLARVNVHIDSLRPERYRKLAGGALSRSLDGLVAAIENGLSPKINVVVQRGSNEGEVVDFCDLARRWRVPVRFIELMDTGAAPEVARGRFLAASDVAKMLHSMGAQRQERGVAPAVDYLFPDGTVVGVIASESQPFCDSCNRLRLGATGVLRTCLYAASGLDLGALLLEGRPERELVAAAREHIAGKHSCHPSLGFVQRRFSMAEVGG